MTPTRSHSQPVTPRKEPVQERSRRTVETILEGAAQVLEREGYEAATTDRIAERAGVSVGSVYQYFPNKDAILLALGRCHFLEGAQHALPVFRRLHAQTPPLAEVVHELVVSSVASHRRRPRLHRVLFEETRIPPELERDIEKLGRAARHVLAAYLSRAPDVGVPRPELAAQVVLECLVALSHRVVLEPPSGASGEQAEAEVERLLLRYLCRTP